ncbi:redoxin domain-containing protein [Euzebya pacifica]|uniref:redoxin domain-containing protein n=1 Tax=Euzebya pacifica TaxID=1608957 RepID=UPI0030F6AB15
MIDRPTPGQSAPDLNVDLVGGGSWKLADRTPDAFSMLVFYRGLHCPVCRSYNRKLDRMTGDFADLGVEPIAISMDTQSRATESVEEWGIEHLPVGYGMTEDDARTWGLYISTAIKDGEPARFSEPGLFLVGPDRSLFYAAVTSMPWGRPDPEEMVKAIGWIQDNDYPSRGRAS